MNEKTCSKCKTIKPVAEFHRNIAVADGLDPRCKSCITARNTKANPAANARNRRARLLSGLSSGEWTSATKAQRTHWRAVADELAEAGSTYQGAIQARETRRDGIVYVITHPRLDGVKIGKAFDAESRLKGYQTGCPNRAYTLAYVSEYLDDCGAVERTVHDWCAESRLQGEWFSMTPGQAREAIKHVINLQRNIQEELF